MTSSSPQIETLPGAFTPTCGEGPHWDVATQSLYYVDIISGGLHRWNSATRQESKISFDGTCSFVIPCDRGGLIAGLNRTIAHVDFDSKKTTTLAEVDHGTKNRFNDAKADASGRLWAGTMGPEKSPGVLCGDTGFLYSFSSDSTVKKHIGDIKISNGIDWTDDNTVMYYIDSVPRKVYAFDFNLAEGSISNQRDAIDFNKLENADTFGLPDGMCVDAEGKIWVACFSASQVCRFDPETSKVLQTIKLPTTNITSVCFGGKNLDELYVTCSAYMLPEALGPQPKAGSVFRITNLGVKGRAANNVK